MAETGGSPGTNGSGADCVLDLMPESGIGYLTQALADIGRGLAMWRLGWALGWVDIKLRYRGSLLGPLWLTFSTAVMVAAMGPIYGLLFHMDMRTYVPFLAVSLVLWGFVSGVANDGATIFTGAAGLIQAARLPFTLHALRALVRNSLILLHNVIVIVVVFALCGVVPAHLGGALPAVVLWGIDGLALSLLLGVVGTRFRDIPPIVSSLMTIAFFVTPVLWEARLVTVDPRFLLFNPFYALLDIIRAPLLGAPAALSSWVAALAYSVLLWVGMLLLFARLRSRLAYWV